MPSKSRKAAIRQSNTRKRKKVTKPNIKNFDLEKPQDINEITEINKDNSDYNNIAQHTRDISKFKNDSNVAFLNPNYASKVPKHSTKMIMRGTNGQTRFRPKPTIQ